MALHISTFDGRGSSTIEDPEEISDYVAGSSCLVWIDVTDASTADFEEIAKELELHPLALEDARKHRQRPKIETYPTHAFVVAYSRDLAEVDCFIGPNWVVTVCGRGNSGEPFPIETVRQRFERIRGDVPSVAALLYVLLDDIVDGYFAAADVFEDEVEDFEQCILGEENARGDGRAIQRDLVRLRRELVEFRRRVIPLRDVLAVIV
ncbi:MAG: CorA family divalent cation transporter, partial [Acidimicrobiia bacterium]